VYETPSPFVRAVSEDPEVGVTDLNRVCLGDVVGDTVGGSPGVGFAPVSLCGVCEYVSVVVDESPSPVPEASS